MNTSVEQPAVSSTDSSPKRQRKLFGSKKQNGGKASKRRWIFLLLVVVVIILGAFFLLRNKNNTKTQNALNYTTAAVSRQSIEKSISGSGTLKPADSYTVTTLTEGDILSADFEEGDQVEKDAVLYEIDSSDAATNIEQSQISLNQAQRNYQETVDHAVVKATTAGIVYSLEVSVGDEVNAGQTLATIRDSDTMKLTVPFPVDDAKAFYVGQSATITLDGTFETLTGTVSAISGSDIVQTGNMIVRNVTILVKNPGGLSNMQNATASIGGVNCAGSGTFAYQSERTLTASIGGTVTAINAPEGSTVSKNQAVVTLGGDDLNDQIQNASDNLRNAELSMKRTQKQLDNYTITSPISGTIVDKAYKAGDTIESGKTLCTIYDLSYLEMTLNIDELDINAISVGQSVQITADAIEGETFTGVVTKVSVAGTTTGGTTTYPVTIQIDEPGDLWPGMNVDAVIMVAESKDALAVPTGAVNRGNTVLITADSPSAANALDQQAPDGYVYVSVETGISNDDFIEITSGLQEGDTVAYVPTTSGSGDTYYYMGGDMNGGGPGGGPDGGGPSGGPGGGPTA